MMRPNSDGLELLEQIIMENKQEMSNELFNGLEEAYNFINEEMVSDGLLDYKYDGYKVDTHLSKMEEEFRGAFDKIESITNFNNGNAEELQDKISDVIEDVNYDLFEYIEEDKQFEDQISDIEKMINAGYSFNTGIGAEYTKQKEKQEAQKKLDNKLKERELAFEREWKEKNVHDMNISVLDIGIYKVISYRKDVDAVYNEETGKVKGKGSRNHKDIIIETVNSFKNCVENFKYVAN